MRRITHTWTDDSATIGVEGLATTVRMLHLTDTHLLHFDERDGDHARACGEFCIRFAATERDAQGNSYDSEDAFDRAMTDAASMELDVLALTGDILHYPSPANVERAAGATAALGVRALYTCGNHAVHYTDEPVNDRMRLKSLPALEPLHRGAPDCSAANVGGIRFVSIDSSLAQISVRQLEFMRHQLNDGAPVVLLTHWPVSLPTLRDRTVEELGAPILIGDPDWSQESRRDWQVSADTKETLQFVALLTSAVNLVGVFCGHIHFPHVDAVNARAAQYVGRPGFEGGRRFVEFRPLP